MAGGSLADEGLRNRPGSETFKVPSNRGRSYHCVFVAVDDSALREIFSVLPALVRTSLSSLASHPIAISRTWSESFVSFFSRRMVASPCHADTARSPRLRFRRVRACTDLMVMPDRSASWPGRPSVLPVLLVVPHDSSAVHRSLDSTGARSARPSPLVAPPRRATQL